jgi:hypothetical protein
MKKCPSFLLVAALAVAGGVFALCYFAGSRVCVWRAATQTNELGWLQREFHLDDAEMRRISALHEGYKPVCEEMCLHLATKNKELAKTLASRPGVTLEVERLLSEIAALRVECQTKMLHHFQEVANSMPAAQGERYLAEMERVTLGLSSGQERGMEMSPPHEHP